MIVTELYMVGKDGTKLFRRYSSENLIIRQNETGIEYAEAIDVENAPFTYTETDRQIEEVE